MKQAGTKKREEDSGLRPRLVERVGAGPWNAWIWKADSEEGLRVWFEVEEETKPGDGRKYRAEDICPLVKLVQVLSATLVFEGCVEGRLRKRLLELAESLDGVLGRKESVKQMVAEDSSPSPASD